MATPNVLPLRCIIYFQMKEIKALIFDVFGTVVDWRSAVIAKLKALGEQHGTPPDADWAAFAQEWREGYSWDTYRISQGDPGPSSVDIIHRENLDKLLDSTRWVHIGAVWDEKTRSELNLVWHRLEGWPDASEGLTCLKKYAIIATLSNGNISLLVDMHANLPWDVVFSAEMFNTFKPNPRAYQGVIRHLSLPPENCAMVASHIHDLRAAASQGMKTIYVRRTSEDTNAPKILAKQDGGEVDYVVDTLTELCRVFASTKV